MKYKTTHTKAKNKNKNYASLIRKLKISNRYKVEEKFALRRREEGKEKNPVDLINDGKQEI